MTNPVGVKVSILNSFEAARESWTAVEQLAAASTVFQSWIWQDAWWAHYSAGRELLVLVAESEGEPVGFLALYLIAGFAGMRKLRLVGTGGDTSPDYLGPLIAAGSEAAVGAAFATHIFESLRWDVLDFSDLQPGPLAEEILRRKDGAVSIEWRESGPIHISRLPSNWDSYLSAMHRDRRARLRRLRQRAIEGLSAQFAVMTDAAEMDRAYDRLVELHRMRWDGDESDRAFRTDAYVSFHRSVIHRLAQVDGIRMYCLMVNDEPVAIHYCYRNAREIMYFQSGFDPRYKQYSPGQVLFGFAIEHAIAEGNRVFDMLKGDYSFKQSWTNDVRHTVSIVAQRPTLLGALHRAKQHVFGRDSEKVRAEQ